MPYLGTVDNDPTAHWPLQCKGSRDKDTFTAAIRGAGPGGLAAAVTLARQGFRVRIAGNRNRLSATRTNLVLLRPEAMRRLKELDVVDYLNARGWCPRLDWTKRNNEWLGTSAYDIPVDFEAADYVPPISFATQNVSHLVRLMDLEAALLHVALELGVEFYEEATIGLKAVPNSKRWHAQIDFFNLERAPVDLGFPDLVICASGKRDAEVLKTLGVERRLGLRLNADCLPEHGSTVMRLGPAHENETQDWAAVFMKCPANTVETFEVTMFKETYGPVPQMTQDYVFDHLDSFFMGVQLPRGFPLDNRDALRDRCLRSINQHYKTSSASWEEMSAAGMVVDEKLSFVPFQVETGSCMTYVAGSNVVLIGDLAGSCSPASGFGADVACHHDSRAIELLALDLKAIKRAKAEGLKMERSKALEDFNRRKAESLLLWHSIAGKSYMSSDDAKNIARGVRQSRSMLVTS